ATARTTAIRRSFGARRPRGCRRASPWSRDARSRTGIHSPLAPAFAPPFLNRTLRRKIAGAAASFAEAAWRSGPCPFGGSRSRDRMRSARLPVNGYLLFLHVFLCVLLNHTGRLVFHHSFCAAFAQLIGQFA